MRHRILVVLSCCALVLATTTSAHADTTVAPGGGVPETSSNFVLVGHNALFNRGMNAAPAIYKHFLYVGNRSDGSNSCGDLNGAGPVVPVLTPTNPDGTCTHPHPGILILDIQDPASPTVVGEIPASIAAPSAAGQPEGVTSRELRVWPAKKLLIELTFRCSRLIHVCPRGNDTTFPFDYKFFDLKDPVHPRLISTHVTRSKAGAAIKPHEFYLWVDPKNEERALLWESTPSTSVDPNRPNLVIEDISNVPKGGSVRLVAEGNWNQFFPGAADPAAYDFDLSLHSMAPIADGAITHLAYLRGGYLALDTSQIAAGNPPPGTVLSLNDKLITPIANRAVWGTGNVCTGHTAAGCSESHSAVPVPGRNFELSVDEVYGTFTVPSFGWPWGWIRLIDVADPTQPSIVGEYKLLQNSQAFQGSPGDDAATEQFTSYSSHNPTVLPDLAFDAWHSGGLQAIDISDPSHPTQAGWFSPAPQASVALEDPALSMGPNKVVMWSYPIIDHGLIYVVDIRNGLYVLRYTGQHSDEVKEIRFFEGNSNLGDALRLAGMED
jgi:LVIVD repeat